MELEITRTQPELRRSRRRLEWVLLTSFFLCLLVGFSAMGALLLLWDTGESGNVDAPWRMMQPAQIQPRLALMQLAGDPAEPLAYQALNAGELESTLAIVLFGTEIAPQPRALLFERLARRYAETDQLERAAQLRHLTRALAVLEPALSTAERTRLLTQGAEDLLAVDARGAALDQALQAKRIGAQTPGLLPAQRSQIFEALRPLARQLDDPDFAQQIRELARNPLLDPGGVLITPRLHRVGAPLETDPAVAQAVAARQDAARALVERLAQLGSAPRAELAANVETERRVLAQALLAEEQARKAQVDNILDTLPPAQQFTLLRSYRGALALKARIALNGFGLSLVPEWESNIDFILQELSSATEALNSTTDLVINTLDTALEKASLRVEKLLWLALQAELGLHPTAALPDLNNDLRFAQDEMALQGAPLALPVLYERNATPPGFRIRVNAAP